MKILGRSASVIILALTAVLLPLRLTRAAPATVDIQFLNVSDWHGQLDPLFVFGVGNVGGAAQLSTYFKAERMANPNTITLTAGDAFGATPPLSNFFGDEPTVKAMRLMGFNVDTFGNHNFDHGIAYLQSLINLAGAASGAQPGMPFSYVSANLQNVAANLTGVSPYKIFTVAGIKIGVIGITNPEAPTLVKPGNFGTIVVTDPIQAVKNARDAAEHQGATLFVVITHMGVTGFDLVTGAPSGPLIDFANNIHGIDVIFGDHTDVQFSGVINQALVLENQSKGATYARTKLTVRASNGTVLNKSTEFVTPLSNAVTADPDVVNMLAPYRSSLSGVLDGTIGVATNIFPGGGAQVERSTETATGDLIADAVRGRYGSQLALLNAGSIRDSLPSSGYSPANLMLRRLAPPYVVGPPYDLVIGDVYTVLPFGNVIVTRTITGAQLFAALENGVSQIDSSGNGTAGRFPQVSGFQFTFHYLNPVGSRVTSVTLDGGTPILPDATTYTFATNDFVNTGGDGYTVFADGQGVTRELLAAAVQDSIQSAGTITPTVAGRITKLP